MIINAKLNRKEPRIEFDSCSVDRIIELDSDSFQYFANHLLEDYPFISENKDWMMYDEKGIRHCLLVVGEGFDDGILVESEGSDYARYSCLIPNARSLVNAELNSEDMNNSIDYGVMQ